MLNNILTCTCSKQMSLFLQRLFLVRMLLTHIDHQKIFSFAQMHGLSWPLLQTWTEEGPFCARSSKKRTISKTSDHFSLSSHPSSRPTIKMYVGTVSATSNLIDALMLSRLSLWTFTRMYIWSGTSWSWQQSCSTSCSARLR